MRTKRVRHIVDILLGIGLILLMSYQVAGEEGHEWTGIAMTALMLIHQVLNQKWYAAMFKGKYAPLRIVQTVINLTLLGCFLLTALSGINMGVYAVPSLAEFMKASTGRRMHLALSHLELHPDGAASGAASARHAARRQKQKGSPDRLLPLCSGRRRGAVLLPEKQLSGLPVVSAALCLYRL